MCRGEQWSSFLGQLFRRRRSSGVDALVVGTSNSTNHSAESTEAMQMKCLTEGDRMLTRSRLEYCTFTLKEGSLNLVSNMLEVCLSCCQLIFVRFVILMYSSWPGWWKERYV